MVKCCNQSSFRQTFRWVCNHRQLHLLCYWVLANSLFISVSHGFLARKTVISKCFERKSKYNNDYNNNRPFLKTFATSMDAREATTTKHDRKSSPPATGLSEEKEQQLDSLLSNAVFQQLVLMDGQSSVPSDILLKSPIHKLWESCASSVHVQNSSIPQAGRGLFASKDIPSANQIVSFYPVHSMGVNFQNSEASYTTEFFDEDSESDSRSSEKKNSAYTLYVSPKRGHIIEGIDLKEFFEIKNLYIDVNLNINLPHDAWKAHFINDGATVQSTSTVTRNEEDDIIDDPQYYPKSQGAANCVFISFGGILPFVAAVTTRPISKGEELFITYGYSYWLDGLKIAQQEAVGVGAGEDDISKISTSSKRSESPKHVEKYESAIAEQLSTIQDIVLSDYAEEIEQLEEILAYLPRH